MPLTKIKSLGITDGTITGDDINSTFNLTGKTVTLPAGTGGKVLQVVSTTKTDTFSSASSSFVDITGMSVSITPSSASNKILVLVDAACGATNSDDYFHVKLLRGATDIYIGDAAGSRIRSWWSFYVNSSNGTIQEANFLRGSGIYLDNPNTTSSITYKLQVRHYDSGTFYLNTGAAGVGSDITAYGRGASSITVMEIAG